MIKVKSAKAKGRKAQQYVAEQISRITGIPWGKDELIRSREGSQSGVDVVLLGEAKELFPFSCEVKSQKRLDISGWIRHAKANQLEDTDWLLFCKRSREEPIVIMEAEAFFKWFSKVKRS